MTESNGINPPDMSLVVRADPGDSFQSIAAQFGCDLADLRAANPEVRDVETGTEMVVPMRPSRCMADPGDTFETIAAQFGITPDRLRAVNPEVGTVTTGTVLNLP